PRAIERREGHGAYPAASSRRPRRPVSGLRREFRRNVAWTAEPVELMHIAIEPCAERHVFSVRWIVRGEGDPVAADDVPELRWFVVRRAAPRWRSGPGGRSTSLRAPAVG